MSGSGDLQPNSGLRYHTDEDSPLPETINPIIDAVESLLADYATLKANIGQELWIGQVYPTDSQNAKPSKKLEDCFTGWVIRWQRYTVGEGTDDAAFMYTHIPKSHLEKGQGLGIRLKLFPTSSLEIQKYIYVYNDRITGVADNNAGDAARSVISGVYEY